MATLIALSATLNVEAEVADPRVHEVDHVAVADPVDEIADRAAEQQAQGDGQDHVRLGVGVIRR